MRIKGSLAKGLLIALAVALIPVTAVSAQKITPGRTCKVMNQKVVYLNKTYTCIKSKNKLVWNKGVAVKKPTLSSLDPSNPKVSGRDLCETQSPGEAFNQTPIITQPRNEIYNTLWEKYKVNKPSKYDTIHSAVKISYAKSTAGIVKTVPAINLYIDPEILSDVNLAKHLEGINTAWQSLSLLMKSDFKKPISIILFTDWKWLKQIHIEGGCSPEKADARSSESMSSFAGWASQDILSLYFNYSGDKRRSLEIGIPGYLAAHELFHLIQFQNFDSSRSSSGTNVPGWFVEGGASAVPPLALGIEPWFLSSGDALSTQNDPKSSLEGLAYTQGIYTLGSIGSEFLIYLTGFDNYMNIWAEMGKGKDFSRAFREATNIELSDFYSMFEEIRPDIGLPIQ